MPEFEVVRLQREDLPALIALFRKVDAEEHPQNPHAADAAEHGLRRALAAQDVFASESFWVFAARCGGELVAYAMVARIPKLDDRIGFLFIDEVYVLRAHRRGGVARALLAAITEHGLTLGLSGVRLIVEPENAGARALYHAAKFTQKEAVFAQRFFARG